MHIGLWIKGNLRALILYSLCIPAFFIPRYLLLIHKAPPVGVYIAIMGLLGAIATFIETRAAEKAGWIALLTLMMVAEIRNLYVADADQLEKFSKISNELDATQKGLTATAIGIRATTDILQQNITNSQNQFAATIEKTNAVLTNVTGGSSYAVLVPMLANLLGGQDIPLAVENHGQNVLTGISVTMYDTGLWLAGTRENILRSVRNRRYIPSLHKEERLVLDVQIRPEDFMALDNQRTKYRLIGYIAAQNFTVEEYLDFKKEPNGLWLYRYKAYKMNLNSEYVAARRKNKGPVPPFLEAVDWCSDVNRAVPIKIDPGPWN